MSSLLGSLHDRLSRSSLALWCAVKLQNQCSSVIGRAHGGANPDHTRNGESTFMAALPRDLRRWVDVGANRGAWTAMFLDHQPEAAQGLLFEPSLSALGYLRPRFAGDARVQIVEAAAGGAPGLVEFFEEPDAGETSSLAKAHASGGAARAVPMTTIDAEAGRLGWSAIDFLKIDAEGFDFQVLSGARGLLEAGRIRMGQFEYGPGWRQSGATLTHALQFLAAAGYQCRLLTREGLAEPRPDWFGEYFGYSNYAFFSPASLEIERRVREGWQSRP